MFPEYAEYCGKPVLLGKSKYGQTASGRNCFSTSETMTKEFERLIAARFALEFKGQVSWYLSVKIKQDKDFNITIDQDRYVQSILHRFLDQAKTKESKKLHSTPLPCNFKATKTDLANSEEESQQIQEEFNIDFAACVGCLIYLSYTRPDIIFGVNKMAKFTRKPGRYH